jgi:hypothetical protein
MGRELRFPGIREPVLSASQELALREASEVPLDLSVDAVLSASRLRTGLDGFGPEDFIERLELLLDVVSWEGHTKFAKVSTFRRIVEKAVNRQLTFDLLRRHPEILEEPIHAPIVVCGLPRSGTTHLLNLIAADRRFQSLPYWEVLRPIPLPGEDASSEGGVDPRWHHTQAAWQLQQERNPFAAAHHPMDPDHISEDGELQMQDFSSYVWEFSLHAPAWRDYYLAHDQTPHYAFERVLLQILQWQRGTRRRWVVKAPQHIEQLPAIMNVFPDAVVVVTHRDPIASLQSIVTSTTYMNRINRRAPEPEGVLAYWEDRYERLLDAYLRDVDLVPPAQLYNCDYRDFVGNDVATVERIYAQAAIEMTGTARDELHAYMDAHEQGHAGRLVYDLRGDFGVSPEELRERYAAYTEQTAVTIEVK